MAYPAIPQPVPSGSDGKPMSIGNSQRLAFDTLLRRELKIGDPNDAQQIARALLDRYQSDARAQGIGGEAQGLPFLNTAAPRPSAIAAPEATATNLDLDQARADVEQDLQQLIASNLTKDIRPELEGWHQTLSLTIDDGVAAARQSLDPYSRDRAFAARRRLGEYARLARMVGALSTELNESYRNLGQSLDEVAAVLLVLMGEALANTGFQGGRTLLRVPYSELQARRDQVLVCLRNMSGVAQESLDQNTMPRGLAAYRGLHASLEAHGQSDLRALLHEADLSRAMDEMIQLCAGGSSDGLRRVGATAWNMLGRFSRFVQVTLHLPVRDAPPLLAFQDALQLFVDGFQASGGLRLLRIARPSVLMYGLYGGSGTTFAEQRLMNLVSLRGRFASTIDCVTRCDCDPDTLKLQVLLDRVLHDLDRAIDLYANGTEEFGMPEQRAAAHAIFALALRYPDVWLDAAAPMKDITNPDNPTGAMLSEMAALLIPAGVSFAAPQDPVIPAPQWRVWDKHTIDHFDLTGPAGPTPLAWLMHGELVLQLQAERALRPIVEQMTSGCIPASDMLADATLAPVYHSPPHMGTFGNIGMLPGYQRGALMMIEQRVPEWHRRNRDYREHAPQIPPHPDGSIDRIAHELGERNRRRLLTPGTSAVPPAAAPAPLTPGAADAFDGTEGTGADGSGAGPAGPDGGPAKA
ncbi:hypothetical protein CMPELA_09820 [Cupriavidus necator]|uniref:Uncharacterized protein n=1 Tax=Cupriavidus necator (strain ATCC 17699 / DSM 428 / KCTC 22496 / NCIMB 10442 / H16 / Stanier 337) TaxID=381666 RepID=Q0KAC6_CUPNH|nr:hypothetical protein [Cupriavidus necator]QCC00878.1 hypothetical protein E6A55_09940 [Cupriavidus necator H16]QQB76292.1 hypothetical protein I6H87_16190 [Cupriavidus necator]WKA39247.1 hypothetical protein QWP09_09950 [Cupriavidus necator]CAJ93045.1 Hypothetical protein H16_A1944 [Cupriavidus necator H16]